MEASGSTQIRVIEPARGFSPPDFREIWAHRDLVFFLARRDVAIRYKQAVIGVFWALLQPMLLAAVFSVFFGLLAKVDPPAGIPYPLFAVSGMVMWLFFSTAVQNSAESTVLSADLISKAYFPRIVIPTAAVLAPAVDFVFAFVVVVVVAAFYGFYPGPELLTVPFFGGLALIAALGSGLWFSALNVRYRDIHLLVPFLLLVGLFVTPIIYPIEVIPDNLQPLYALNPMLGAIEGFRWALLGTDWPGYLLAISAGVALILFVTGAIYFQRAERSFADVI